MTRLMRSQTIHKIMHPTINKTTFTADCTLKKKGWKNNSMSTHQNEIIILKWTIVVKSRERTNIWAHTQNEQ